MLLARKQRLIEQREDFARSAEVAGGHVGRLE
jgi:hypothetical protein